MEKALVKPYLMPLSVVLDPILFRFRSLCWKVFLRCLSEDVDKWEAETADCRLRYRDLKRKYSLNPRSADEAEQLDLNLNNPLSQVC